MGNTTGKPVVFTDEGRVPEPSNLLLFEGLENADICFYPTPVFDPSVLTTEITTSQPQPLPIAARDRQRGIWKGQDSGTQGYRVNVRLEIHSER